MLFLYHQQQFGVKIILSQELYLYPKNYSKKNTLFWNVPGVFRKQQQCWFAVFFHKIC